MGKCGVCEETGARNFDGLSGRYLCDHCFESTNSAVALARKISDGNARGLGYEELKIFIRRRLNRAARAACENIARLSI